MRHIGLAISLCACVPSGYLRADVDAASLTDEPAVKTVADPTVDVSQRTTVLLLPHSDSNTMDSIVERQMLFLLHSELEARGYKVVTDPTDGPQLLATVRFIEEFVTSQIPAHYDTMPVWVPSRQWTAKTRSNGNLLVYRAGEMGFGAYEGTSNTTVTQPGYLGSQQIYVPPRSSSAHVAALGVDLYDVEVGRVVWKGAAVARTTARDGRFAGHQLLRTVLRILPEPRNRPNVCSGGWTGIDVKVVSLDANSFVPVISRTTAIARRAGIRTGQILELVGSARTANQTYAELIGLLCGPEESSVEVLVWDGEKRRVINLRRTAQAGATWDD